MKFIVRCAGGAEMCCSSSSMTVSRRQKSWQPTNACVKLELNPVQFETRSPERCRWERLSRMVPLARETELRFPNWTRFKTLVFHFNDDRVVVGISNVGQVVQTAVRDRAGAENRLAVLEEVDDLVVAHPLSHVYPLPISGLAASLSLYPSLSLL